MVQLAHIFKKDKDKEKHALDSRPPSFSASRSPSTKSPKPKSPTKSPKSPAKSPSKSSKPSYFSHSRSSSSGPTNFKFSRSSRDQDTHPLNLPPDELRRRLSAMAASKEDQRSSMDIDPQEPQNGVNGKEERSPTPPPHRPTAASADEADSFKLAGNKFFKDGNYRRAIEEYNKGMPTWLHMDSSLESWDERGH